MGASFKTGWVRGPRKLNDPALEQFHVHKSGGEATRSQSAQARAWSWRGAKANCETGKHSGKRPGVRVALQDGGAGRGTRTRTALRPKDFKSHASTIPPRPQRFGKASISFPGGAESSSLGGGGKPKGAPRYCRKFVQSLDWGAGGWQHAPAEALGLLIASQASPVLSSKIISEVFVSDSVLPPKPKPAIDTSPAVSAPQRAVGLRRDAGHVDPV